MMTIFFRQLFYDAWSLLKFNQLILHTWGRARIGPIYCLNYLGRKMEASEMKRETLEKKLLPKEYLLEPQWIQNIHLTQSEAGLSALLPKIRKGQDFFASTYIIETVFWSHAFSNQEFITRVPSLPMGA